jgi:hypothetical protein
MMFSQLRTCISRIISGKQMVLVLTVPATSSPVESHAVILNEDQVAEISYLVLEVMSMSEDPNLGSPLPLLNKSEVIDCCYKQTGFQTSPLA